MTITCLWDDTTPMTLRFDVTEPWTWAELEQIIVDLVPTLHGRRAHVLIRITGPLCLFDHALFKPQNLDRARRILALCEQHAGLILVIGADADARMLFDWLRQLNQRAVGRVRFCEDASQARDYLQQADHLSNEVAS